MIVQRGSYFLFLNVADTSVTRGVRIRSGELVPREENYIIKGSWWHKLEGASIGYLLLFRCCCRYCWWAFGPRWWLYYGPTLFGARYPPSGMLSISRHFFFKYEHNIWEKYIIYSSIFRYQVLRQHLQWHSHRQCLLLNITFLSVSPFPMVRT